MEQRSRRDVLRAGLGTTAAVAGCLGFDPLSGSPASGTYRDWLPAPEALDVEPYGVVRVDVGGYRAGRDALHPATRLLVRQRFVPRAPLLEDRLGPPGELVTFPGSVGGIRVREGIQHDDPGGALVDAGYEPVDERGPFVVYGEGRSIDLPPGAPRLVAVGDAGVAHTPAEDPLPVGRHELETVLDARRGEVPRYHDRHDGIRTAATTLSERTVTRLVGDREAQPFPTVVASAQGWQLDGDRTDLRWVLRFEDSADAEVVDVRGELGPALSAYRNLTVSRSGATVDLRAEVATDRLDFTYAGDPGEDGIPYATFAIEWLGTTARVAHDGGQAVPSDRLQVTVDGEPTARQFADGYETVAEGDAIEVDLGAGRDVAVVWEHPDSGDRLTLGSTRIAT